MSVAERSPTSTRVDPCPMCGHRFASPRGECTNCGERLFVPEPPVSHGHLLETPPALHRVLGTILLSLTVPSAGGMLVGILVGLESGRVELVLTRGVLLGLLCYGIGVGTYQLLLGRAPRHHRWRRDAESSH